VDAEYRSGSSAENALILNGRRSFDSSRGLLYLYLTGEKNVGLREVSILMDQLPLAAGVLGDPGGTLRSSQEDGRIVMEIPAENRSPCGEIIILKIPNS
jgi:hypothetical protein